MSLIDSLASLRRDYKKSAFTENTALKDPFEQFKLWFQDAGDIGIIEPNAMVVSTVSKDGKPSSRVLLLKDLDKQGFVFYTNYESRKGKEIQNNSSACILFYWDKLERQIRISGNIEKISAIESDDYFAKRPYESRLGAWASKQSQQLISRFTLLRQVSLLMVKFPITVPRPPHWGGYRLIPENFEFWQGRESRLHDRIYYYQENHKWKIIRLYP